jgi:hypothetical protein
VFAQKFSAAIFLVKNQSPKIARTSFEWDLNLIPTGNSVKTNHLVVVPHMHNVNKLDEQQTWTPSQESVWWPWEDNGKQH